MIVNDFHWIGQQKLGDLEVRFRHGPAIHKAVVTMHGAGIKIELQVPSQQGIAAGQCAVLYDGDICLGGGMIDIAF